MPTFSVAYDSLPSEALAPSTSSTLCDLPENDASRAKEEESSSGPPNPDEPSRACRSQHWKNWKWECAACLITLGTPIIIFASLYPHDGQPVPQWPFDVSVNSLLSIYALVLKTAIGFILASCVGQLQWTWFSSDIRPLADMLHFYNATRSPYGALGLVWRQRLRQTLTVLRCTIMVLTVAVDPFIQQLVRPVDCSVQFSGKNAVATLPRTNFFDTSVVNNAIFSPGQTHGVQQLVGNSSLSSDAQGKVYHYATCLQIQWPWISFPASLAILITVFLVIVMEVTRKEGTPMWKALPLAWILMGTGGLGGVDEGRETASTAAEELEERSERIAVHLARDGQDGFHIRMGGWTMSKIQFGKGLGE